MSIEELNQLGLAQWKQLPHWARGPAHIEGEEVVLDEDRAQPYYIFEPAGLLIDLASIGAENWLTRDPRGVLSFVRRYGLLWHGAADLGTGKCREPLSHWWDEAGDIMWMLDLYKRLTDATEQESADPLRKAIAKDFYTACKPEPASDEELMDCASVILAGMLRQKLGGTTISIASSVELDTTPRGPGIFLLQQHPSNLPAAAYADLAQAMVSRAPMRRCEGCGRMFIPESRKQKYHNPSCASTARWRRWKERQSADTSD